MASVGRAASKGRQPLLVTGESRASPAGPNSSKSMRGIWPWISVDKLALRPDDVLTALYTLRSVEDTARDLGADTTIGLTTEEAARRQVRYGRNELVRDAQESLLMKFVDQLRQPLILLLIASAVVSVVMRQYDDAVSILLAVLIVVGGNASYVWA